MPQCAAGCRMEPPGSDPRAIGTIPDATETADPPLEPPGMRSCFHGLRVGPNAEFSVEDPIANSSRLVLPIRMAPARRTRATTVASYGGTKLSSECDAAVV